jgi:hypothetical protein
MIVCGTKSYLSVMYQVMDTPCVYAAPAGPAYAQSRHCRVRYSVACMRALSHMPVAVSTTHGSLASTSAAVRAAIGPSALVGADPSAPTMTAESAPVATSARYR